MSVLTLSLPEDLRRAFTSGLDAWQARDGTRRLHAKDATLWTNGDEARWLGWLAAAETERRSLSEARALADELVREGFSHVAVLGMGGSSLCPYVLATTFGPQEGRPALSVLDSTDPSQIRAFEDALDLPHTLFVVSSKSGSTLEVTILRNYFLARMRELVGDRAGQHFIAITDPGSSLEEHAASDKFRAVLAGVPEIGGRFSALSHFGMAPALLAGLDVEAMLSAAEAMERACAVTDASQNPGVLLGVLLSSVAAQGRDKLTIVTSPAVATFGSWLEQLVAESTGKQGQAIIPVDLERLTSPARYGEDRLFVQVRLESESDDGQEEALAALEADGHPVARLVLEDLGELGGEFFLWEMATAVCGAGMNINPFDQPDVEAAKAAARRLTDEYEKSGELPGETPMIDEGGLKLFADAFNEDALVGSADDLTPAALLKAHLARLGPGDYFAIQAYLEMNDAHTAALQSIRHRVRDAHLVATTLGYGPRFLHSTGQAHKGGPNSGVFLQITCDEAQDLPVPGRRYSFGTVKAAQARGDFAVLAERGRRALRVHLGADVAAGLKALDAAVRQALS